MSEIEDLEVYEDQPIQSAARSTSQRLAGLRFHKAAKARGKEKAAIAASRRAFYDRNGIRTPSLPRLKFLEHADD